MQSLESFLVISCDVAPVRCNNIFQSIFSLQPIRNRSCWNNKMCMIDIISILFHMLPQKVYCRYDIAKLLPRIANSLFLSNAFYTIYPNSISFLIRWKICKPHCYHINPMSCFNKPFRYIVGHHACATSDWWKFVIQYQNIQYLSPLLYFQKFPLCYKRYQHSFHNKFYSAYRSSIQRQTSKALLQ